jgi:pyruvate-formate lyase-activating enzyme
MIIQTANIKSKNILDEETRGVVFNIQTYSLHDGPGMRTTVFLEGCPLK